jgi:hypothetical protein
MTLSTRREDIHMNKLKTRVLAAVAGVALTAGLGLAAAAPASASPPQAVASTVTCYNGAAACTQYHYSFYPPGTTGGAFHVYYTVQWSTSKASYKVIRVSWTNNSNHTVYYGSYGLWDGAALGGWAGLGIGSSGSTYAIGPNGASYTFSEAQFNGPAKGVYIPKNTGAYGSSEEVVTSYAYHTTASGQVFYGEMLLG